MSKPVRIATRLGGLIAGSTCYPVVPLSSGDVRYFNSLEPQLNAVIKRAAQANGASYEDTFTTGVGHDACKGSTHG